MMRRRVDWWGALGLALLACSGAVVVWTIVGAVRWLASEPDDEIGAQQLEQALEEQERDLEERRIAEIAKWKGKK